MGKASERWTSFQDLDRESEHAQEIDKILNTGDFVCLRSVALQARYDEDSKSNIAVTPQTQVSRLTCAIDISKFAVGYNNVVTEVEFSDSSQRIARVRLPYDKSNEKDSVEAETSMISELLQLKRSPQGPVSPSPKSTASTSTLKIRSSSAMS